MGGQRRLKVLVSAFCISPYEGSEPGMGWQLASRLAGIHDVTVICGDMESGRKTENLLSRYFETNPLKPKFKIFYVEPSWVMRSIWKLHKVPGLWALYYVAYNLWQQRAYQYAVTLHSQSPFDIVHQHTLCTYREPGYMWKMPVPFVWGPISGASSPPFWMSVQMGGARFFLRYWTNALQRRFAWRSAKAARKSFVTLTVTDDDKRIIERWGGRAEYLCEVGTENIKTHPQTYNPEFSFKIVWSGLHIKRKALSLAIEALAQLQDKSKYHLDILGAGPLTSEYKKLAVDLAVDPMITWHGRLSRVQALEIMSQANILLHTSISESTSQVVLEALSLGLPVLCHDACGMQTAVTDDCGIRIPLRSRTTSVNAFAAALQLICDPEKYPAYSRAALRRAHELTWDSAVQHICNIYESAST